MASKLTKTEIATYHEDGLLFLRELFDPHEIDLLRRAMEEDPEIREHSLLRADQEGGARLHVADERLPPFRRDSP